MCLHVQSHDMACGCVVSGLLRGSSLEFTVFCIVVTEGSIVSDFAHCETEGQISTQSELALKAALCIPYIMLSCWSTSAVTRLRDRINIYRMGQKW